ncbi:MAG TPA: SIMPL domain-containing protein [Steroidobacteraceae bacterium]|nr:SIMPL domain-containing protein [Steroidobacteraceae bacterium]
MPEATDRSRTATVPAAVLAVGLVIAAFVLGAQLKHVGSARDTIVVKGLAEKPIRADQVEWTVGLRVYGDTLAQTLALLRKERPLLDAFLDQQGIDAKARAETGETIDKHMEEVETSSGRVHEVQKGFVGTQEIVIRSNDLAKIAAANKAALQFKADGRPVVYSDPLYLVSDLEAVKMSLIGDATRNAHTRAEEFARNGGVKVGTMSSASQGSFYILAAGANEEASDYGGIYDKSTVEKLARVVVTIEYNIEQ